MKHGGRIISRTKEKIEKKISVREQQHPQAAYTTPSSIWVCSRELNLMQLSLIVTHYGNHSFV